MSLSHSTYCGGARACLYLTDSTGSSEDSWTAASASSRRQSGRTNTHQLSPWRLRWVLAGMDGMKWVRGRMLVDEGAERRAKRSWLEGERGRVWGRTSASRSASK